MFIPVKNNYPLKGRFLDSVLAEQIRNTGGMQMKKKHQLQKVGALCMQSQEERQQGQYLSLQPKPPSNYK